MPDIVLATQNARYIHTAFSLRCLLANLGDLRERAELIEFHGRQSAEAMADTLLSANPRLLLFGVYIWNLNAVRHLLPLLKQRQPGLKMLLGGPEIAHAPIEEPALAWADAVVRGEGELVTAELCHQLLQGQTLPARRIEAPPPDLTTLCLPYDLYTEEDVKHRLVFVETSRGCPYHCAYCLSSLDRGMRMFDLDRVLPELDRLIDRGVRLLKFLDRSFNANAAHAEAVLSHMLEHYRPGLVLHLEWVPDRTTDRLKRLLERFPPGAIQVEVGIQSCTPSVLDCIGRRQDVDRALEALAWLVQCPATTVHADLIFGLPGETEAQIAEGFDRLVEKKPDRLDVNLLKGLQGTPVRAMERDWALDFALSPPWEIRSTGTLSADRLTALQRFTRYWDLYYNSGRFRESLPLLWCGGRSPFRCFSAFSDFLYDRLGRTHRIDLLELVRGLHDHLEASGEVSTDEAVPALARDYAAQGRRIVPHFLR